MTVLKIFEAVKVEVTTEASEPDTCERKISVKANTGQSCTHRCGYSGSAGAGGYTQQGEEGELGGHGASEETRAESYTEAESSRVNADFAARRVAGKQGGRQKVL